MQILLTVVHIIVALILIIFVLLQSGRGGGMGIAMGGASAQVFGGRGAGTFLSRLTAVSAVIFFLTSLTLTVLSSRHRSVVEGVLKPKTEQTQPSTTVPVAPAKPAETAPAVPAPATP
jgi:preprotein translocase subunit SecG